MTVRDNADVGMVSLPRKNRAATKIEEMINGLMFSR
jgi:hypothetical protein